MVIAEICFVIGAFFCSCTRSTLHCKNAPAASHLIRSEPLLPNLIPDRVPGITDKTAQLRMDVPRIERDFTFPVESGIMPPEINFGGLRLIPHLHRRRRLSGDSDSPFRQGAAGADCQGSAS